MARALITLKTEADRQRAAALLAKAPLGTRCEFKAAKRTVAQNDLLWGRLTDVSRQLKWYGQKLSPIDWKDVFTAALRKSHVVPGIDPGSFVSIGLHTSDLSKDEFSNLLDLIDAFAAERGITLTDVEAKEER